jgi:DNA-binding NarL/FixJ family response regulator
MNLPDTMNAAAEPTGADARPSLLIADDDAVVRATLGAQLNRAFRIIATAENATEAVALAAEHRPDAALIDVDMPAGGARAAVPQIAEHSPDTCMVILSADESRPVVLELLGAGAIAYVRKGVTAAQITKTLTDALQAKAQQPQA